MAITATIVLDRSSTTRNQKVRALLTVSNSGGNPVTVLNCVPFVQNTAFPEPQNSSTAIGQVAPGTVIPAGGSNTLVWDTNFHTANPMTNYDTSTLSNTYQIGCLIYGDDGSVTSPTVQTVTVVPTKNYGSF
jgi:hypothetical protein